MTSAHIPLNQLHEGPSRHAELSPTPVERADRVRLALSDVYSVSLAAWLDDFRRDVHPEQEILWWEHLTQGYLSYSGRNRLNAGQRRAAFEIFLGVAMGTRAEALSGLAAFA